MNLTMTSSESNDVNAKARKPLPEIRSLIFVNVYLISTVDCVLLHVFRHVSVLDNSFTLRHLDVSDRRHSIH